MSEFYYISFFFMAGTPHDGSALFLVLSYGCGSVPRGAATLFETQLR